MVKHAGIVIVKNNKVVARVEQDTGGTFLITTAEFLSEVSDMRSVETETKTIDRNRVMFFPRGT